MMPRLPLLAPAAGIALVSGALLASTMGWYRLAVVLAVLVLPVIAGVLQTERRRLR